MAQQRSASMVAGIACPRRTAQSLRWLVAFMLAGVLVTVGTLTGVTPADGAPATHAESPAHSHTADVPQCHHNGTPNLPAALGIPSREASELLGIELPDRDSQAPAIAHLTPYATCRATLTRIPPAQPDPRGRPAAYLLTRRFRL